MFETRRLFFCRWGGAFAAILVVSCSGRFEHHFSEVDPDAGDARPPGDDGRAPTDASVDDAPRSDGSVDGAGESAPPPDTSDAPPPPADVRQDAAPPPDGSPPFDTGPTDTFAPDVTLPDGATPDTTVVDSSPPPDANADVDTGADAPADAIDAGCTNPVTCTPDVPRLLAPHSTGFVTTFRPTLKWTAAAKATSYRIEVCSDAGCNSIREMLTSTATSIKPSMLPGGTSFWRVIAVNGTFTAPSITWEFRVGARNTPIDTSWLGPSDFNGDGLPDVAFGATNRIHLMMNGLAGAGLPNVPSQTIDGLSGYGDYLAYAGDVNGDGRGDLMVSSRNAGFARLYLGSSNGVTDNPQTLGPGTSAARQFVAGIGDVDGDGYADVAVGEGTTSFEWRIYKGSASGAVAPGEVLGSCPDFTDDDGNGLFEGCHGGAAGDVNGDGFADVIMCSHTANTATVYLLGPAGTVATQVIPMPNGETAFGDSCTGAGDVDGDGYGDVIVGTATDGVYLFLGSPSGIQTTFSASAFGGTGTGASVTSIAPAGDVNGDGFADIIVGAYGANLVKVLHGGMGGTLTSGTTFASLPAGGGYGWSVATVGDVDSDGFAEIAFTPSNCMGHDVYVYRGSALGVDMSTPLNQWAKPSGTTCFGVLAR